MTSTFPTDHFGLERDVAALSAASACEEIIIGFMDRLDDGDLEAAFAHHADDVQFWAPGAAEPTTTRADALAGAGRFRFPYADRVTIHAVSNFVTRSVAPDVLDSSYLITVWELTEQVGGVTHRLAAPRIQLLARERTLFRRDSDGRWWIAEERMLPIMIPATAAAAR